MRLKSLNCNFLTEADILKLNIANIQTTDQLITYSDLNSLSEQTKIPVKNLKFIKKFIIGQYAPFPEQAHSILDKGLGKLLKITTGCLEIDELLCKGVYSGEVTELTGATASGKSELCLNLVSNLLTTTKNVHVLYADSNRGFDLVRLRQLILAKLTSSADDEPSSLEQTMNRLLENVHVATCKHLFELLDILFTLQKKHHHQQQTNEKHTHTLGVVSMPSLIIIDSLDSLVGPLFKPGYSLDASFYLNCVSTRLKYLAKAFNCAVCVVTNRNQDQTNRISNLFNHPNWV